MKRVIVLCLAAMAVASVPNSAQAGRHARRAVRRTTVAVAAVAVARRPTTVVAAAPVVVPRRTVVAAAVAPVPVVAALPDLTVIDVVAEADLLTIVVQNIGQAVSPAAHLQANLCRPDGGALVAAQTLRVLPLAVGQTMRLRLRSAPLDNVEATALVDSANEVAELNERNNDRMLAIAPLPVPPPVLEAEAVWGAAAQQEEAPIN